VSETMSQRMAKEVVVMSFTSCKRRRRGNIKKGLVGKEIILNRKREKDQFSISKEGGRGRERREGAEVPI
jgi:hypothetical protein